MVYFVSGILCICFGDDLFQESALIYLPAHTLTRAPTINPAIMDKKLTSESIWTFSQRSFSFVKEAPRYYTGDISEFVLFIRNNEEFTGYPV